MNVGLIVVKILMNLKQNSTSLIDIGIFTLSVYS